MDAAPDNVDRRRFLETALRLRAGGGVPVDGWVAHIESELGKGRLLGRMWRLNGAPVGLAVWAPGPAALGANLHILYLEGPAAAPENYARLLDAIGALAGRFAFAPGPLAGLSIEQEESLMTGRGYAKFGRSELRLPADRVIGEESTRGPGELRPAEESDLPALAELHRRAYRDRFDRYLFLEEEDEAADALREVREIFEGRWGEIDRSGSVVLQLERKLVASVLAVRRPDGILIADVAVDPDVQGRGLGRRVLASSLEAMHRRGDRSIVLNVTEGNDRALSLYTRLGFVRSLGPSRDWYHTGAIPVRP